jgi:A nuclease family of the HNH/ENDO VII superfamily with conserved AHH
MAGFAKIGTELARVRGKAWHAHHLIPLQCRDYPILAALIANAKAGGFDIDSFADNGILLPYTACVAAKTGLPLHRGSHPVYTKMVQQGLHRMAVPLSPLFALDGDPFIAADMLRRAAITLCIAIEANGAPGNVVTLNELQLPGGPHDDLWTLVVQLEHHGRFPVGDRLKNKKILQKRNVGCPE